jgi:hypothetical protein
LATVPLTEVISTSARWRWSSAFRTDARKDADAGAIVRVGGAVVEGAAVAERWGRDGVRRAVARARRLRASTYEERTECDRAIARHLQMLVNYANAHLNKLG